MTDLHPAVLKSTHMIFKAFKAQYPSDSVYLSRCCGRRYLGINPAVKCRTCDETPKNVEIKVESDLDNL